jgi:protein-tyrosine phosphatase
MMRPPLKVTNFFATIHSDLNGAVPDMCYSVGRKAYFYYVPGDSLVDASSSAFSATREGSVLNIPPMKEPVGSGHLYVGTAIFADTAGALADLGVTHRLSCLMSSEEEAQWMAFAGGNSSDRPHLTFTLHGPDSMGLVTARAPMADEDLFGPYAFTPLEKGAAFLNESLSAGGCCYVHCTHGVSRSPAMVLYFLVQYRKMALLPACTLLKTQRVKASPNDTFVDILLGVEKQAHGKCSDREAVLAVLRKPWLQDFRSGKVKLSQYSNIF